MSDAALNALFENSVGFRLYADHKHGLSIEELALLVSQPAAWVEERVEAMRLCIEQQIRLQ